MLKVKIAEEDEKTFYSHKNIKVRGKDFETPIKAINLRNFRKDIELAWNEFVAEIYKTFSKESLQKFVSGAVKHRDEFNKDIKRQIYGISAKTTPILFIPALKTLSVTEIELDFIQNTQSIFDFYVVPTVERIHKIASSVEDIERYISLVKYYLEKIETVKLKKPIMGTIPITLPPTKIIELIDIYLDREIMSFCIDFAGRIPFTHYQQIAQIQNLLHKNDIDAFIHATNVNIGKPSKKGNIILAQDVLSFGFGLDSIGDNHLGVSHRDVGSQVDNLRLFNKENYAYHKVNQRDIEKIYPKDTAIQIEALVKGPKSKRMDVQKMFNYEQIGIETHKIREAVKEDVIKYISRKHYVTKHNDKLKILIKAKQRETRSLTEFLRDL